MTALFFSLYTVLSGAQQGLIVWLLTEYVPPRFKEWIDAAYHYGGLLIYAVLVAYAARATAANWQLLVAAGLARTLFFDPCLNLARSWFNHREGRAWIPPFTVGTSALEDRALRGLAQKLGMAPEHLRFLGWVGSVVAAGYWLYLAA